MITRGLDGTFYEIPDDMAEEYKVAPQDVQEKMGAGCQGLPDAPMGMGPGPQMMQAPSGGGSPQGVVINVMNPTAVQSPMTGMQQGPPPQGLQQRQSEGAGAQPGATCYSCYCYNCYSCYCYSCYCYSCYCYRTCYSCYIQPV